METVEMRAKRKAPGSALAIRVLACLVILPLGVLFVFVGLDKIRDCRAFRTYPTTTAKIISTDISSHQGSKGGTLYQVDCVYSYSAFGVGHTGSRIYLEPVETSSRAEAMRVAALYPPNSTVTVYYHPHHPTESVIDPRITPEIVMIPTAGALTIAITLSFALFAPYTRRFYAPDLPVNTELADERYVIRPSKGWRTHGLIVSIVLSLIMFASLILSNSRQAEPSMELLWAAWIGIAAAPLAVRTVYALLVHRASGSLVIDMGSGRVQRLAIRKVAARPALDLGFEEIIAVGQKFRPARYARNPGKPNANFCPVISILLPAGNQRDITLGAFEFRRDDCAELIAWMRSVLHLTEDDDQSHGIVEEGRA